MVIRNEYQLFVDNSLISKMDNASLKLNKPEKREVVLTMDEEWETPEAAYYSVVDDGDKIRIYYRCMYGTCDKDENQFTAYAQSDDGIHFTKPNLGLYEYNGSKNNNIIFSGVQSTNFTVFYDENGAADAKYKALGGVPPRGLFAFKSADGIHFTLIQDTAVMTDGYFDSQNVPMYDSNIVKYRCFSRYFTPKNHPYPGVRAIQSTISDDFVNWSDPDYHKYEDGIPYEHFYTNATIQCPDALKYYFSFPMRFIPDRQKVSANDGISDAVFMSSRDGENWDRTFMESWVRPGIIEENWNDRTGMPALGIVARDNEFSIYISELFRTTKNRLRRLSIAKHRFASIHAGYTKGSVRTIGLSVDSDGFKASRLVVNYSTSAAGYIKIIIKDINNYTLKETDEIYGNSIGEILIADLSNIKLDNIYILFCLKDADVYSFRFS